MDGFKVISYKKKRNTVNSTTIKNSSFKSGTSNIFEFNHPSKEYIIERINSAKDDIRDSEFFRQFYQNLSEKSCNLLNIDIITYGLGHFSQCVSSRYQFAFVLILRDYCKSQLFVYDPVFTAEELDILITLDCFVIEANEEGKRKVEGDTIFFLPHCPKQLLNNLLWKNWTSGLSKCVIVGNSIEKIVESHSDRFLKENIPYIFHASSFVTEIKINNCFKFSDIFNDLSIHLFLEQHISNLDNIVLNFNKEPVYKEDDIEFVTDSLINLRISS